MRSLFALLALLAALPCRAEVDPALLKRLQAGGYILYLRHASTNATQKDATVINFDDCATQRNLTDKGRDEARAIGEQLKRLHIPVGSVLSSPFCRTTETARLAFGKAEPTHAVRGADELRKIFATAPTPGTNLAICSHAIPMDDNIKSLAEGEMAVVRPQADSGFAVVGRIRVQDWQALQ